MPRFYVEASYCPGTTVAFSDEAAHHAGRALRMREGDEATLFDGRGHEAQAILHFSSQGVTADIISVSETDTESPINTTLIQALVSQEKLDWVLQKAVELGIGHIVVAPACRSVTKLDAKRLEKRLIQWQKIVLSACEQCGRSYLPTVRYCTTLTEAFRSTESQTKLVMAPAAQVGLPKTLSGDIAFAVGPEGGFSEEELALARDCGFQSVQLGPRVLRTETAALAMLSALQTLKGDFLKR